MKVTIERAALLKALGHIHRIVERRNTIPILSNVLIEARDGKLELKATDLDLEATEIAPADVAQCRRDHSRGAYLPRHRAQAPEGAQVSLEIASDTGQLLLRSGRSRFHLQSLPAADFPDLTAGEFPHKFEMPAVELQTADRERAIRDLDRGDALLPQRHLFPHGGVRRRDHAARGRHRRPPPRPRRDRRPRPAPPGCPASSRRARPSARS